MRMLEKNKLKMLQFTVLGSDCNIFHFITTRHGGTGRGAYGTFNVSPFCGDSPEAVAANRNQIGRASCSARVYVLV